jgi:polyisoprenoid-binding protein YceI
VSGACGRAARACGLTLAFAVSVVVSWARVFPAGVAQATPADLVFDLDPANTKVNFTLGATMHTVHGTFQPLRGRIEYTAATGALRGEIVVDALSGESGDASRDKKMHADVLESEKYPAIKFRPDRVEGKVAPAGESTVQVHGIFSLHGADHELTAPATVKLDGKSWTATVHFTVPYVQWGLKNPSVFLLRVSKAVDIDIAATGTVVPARP